MKPDKYRLLISPSPFLKSYVHARTFNWLILAWVYAKLIVFRNPYTEVIIQKHQ